jgi:hypothetical protein
MRFSKDVDLARWEPGLFGEPARAGQTLCRGTDGVVSGTRLSSAGGAFVNSGVKAGQMVWLSDAAQSVEGAYEVVSVESATALTVSVVRPNEGEPTVGPPAGSGFIYRISTFDPQAEEVSAELLEYLGLPPEGEGVTATDIQDGRVLRQAVVFGVLAAVLASNAAGSNVTSGLAEKAQYYQKLYDQARARLRVGIDKDQDGQAEQVRDGGAVRLRRG